jgi:pimeloyl-ACP methyl ester carboxylesterase
LVIVATPGAATTTVEGQTDGGAYYQIVVPDSWKGDLIIWNHGFDLSPPGPVDDLEESFFLQLLEGYAVAASSYRQSGWAVFKTNKDLEALVREFEARFGSPESIVLVGASLGGIVTAAALEKAELGNVVGALTLCGAMAGSRNWDRALDSRLLYDVVCAGVPGAAIPGGAKGLPKGSDWTRGDVEEAVNECTGSAGQQANLNRLVALSSIPGQFVQSVMWHATFGLSDLVHDRGKLRGKIGAGNRNVDYGDAAINEAIERVRPKKKKARKLARHFTPKGHVGDVKIISLHTDKDGLVIVENESEYAAVVPAPNLTTAIVVEDEPTHCLFSPAEVIAAWEELRRWIDGGPQPTAADVQAECRDLRSLLGGPCRIEPAFEIPSMDGRIRPR